jgi:hypothetical protein
MLVWGFRVPRWRRGKKEKRTAAVGSHVCSCAAKVNLWIKE